MSSEDNDDNQKIRVHTQFEQFDPPSIFDKDMNQEQKVEEKKRNKKKVE